MSSRGRIDDLFDVQKITGQKEQVVSLIKQFVDAVSIGNTAKIDLKNATKASDIIDSINRVSKAQQDQLAIINQSIPAVDNLRKANEKSTEVNKKHAESLTDVEKAKKRLSEASSKEAKELAVYNQQISETNRLNALNANLENAVAGSLEQHKAKIALIVYQLEILNVTTEAGKKKQQELVNELARHTKFVNDNTKGVAAENDAYKQLAIRFAAAAANAKQLAAQYGVLDPRAKAAAKEANALNDQLKKIDYSIGNHQRNVGNYGEAFRSAGEKIKHFGREILTLIGITSLFAFLENSGEEFIKLDKNIRLLEGTLKNLGVPELFGRIEKNVEGLRKEFGYLDQADLTSVFQRLVVYGKLTEKQINDLVPVIINFSAQTGRSLEESTGVILKSLQGSNRGLQEFGISLRDAKTPAEALKIVMTELAPKIDGAGKSFADSASGGIRSARQEFTHMKEELGSGLLPILNNVLRFAINAINGIKKFASDVRAALDPGYKNRLVASEDKKIAEEEAALEYKQFLDSVKFEKQTSEQKKATLEKELKSQEYLLELNKKRHEQSKFDGTFDAKKQKQDLEYRESLIQLIKDQIQLESGAVIGGGDINTPFVTPKPDKKDTKAELFKQLQEERKAKFEKLKQEIADQLLSNQTIIDDERKSYYLRLAAAKSFYDNTFKLAEAQRQFDLTEIDKQAEEDKRKANLEIKNKKDLHNTIEAIDKAAASKTKSTQAKYNGDVLKLNADNEKQILELIKKHDADVNQINKTNHETELLEIQSGYDKALNELDRQYVKKQKRDRKNDEKLLADKREYERKRSLIEINAQIERYKSSISFLEAEIAIEKARIALEPDSDKRDKDIAALKKAEQELAGIRNRMNESVVEFQKKSNETNKGLSDEDTAKRIENFEKVKEKAEQVFSVIGGLINAGVTRELNAIQEQIDLLDKKKEKEIEIANQTITNAQDKANAIAVIEARAAAQKEALERQQRQAKERAAKFEKAANIASIIMNTVVAVMKTYAQAGFFGGLAGAIAVGAIGAAQLAVAIATPIPKYKHGTGKGTHPGGLAEVGDGGKSEAVELPTGEIIKTPSTPVVWNLPKGSKVYPDYSKMMIAATLTNIPEFKERSYSDSNEKVVKGLASVEKAIKKIPQTSITVANPLSQRIKYGSSINEHITRNLGR